MDNNVHLIRTLPRLQIDKDKPDQYDTRGEDHCADELNYAMRRYMNDPSKKRENPYLSQMARYTNLGHRGIM
jgi:hypothetical protein